MMEVIDSLMHAMLYAAEKHKGQTRKDGHTPYLNHLVEVAELVSKASTPGNPSLLIAAILHDVLEDTETPRSELSEKFGAEVASIVEELSDDKTLPKNERRAAQEKKAEKWSISAKRIKLADKISNLREVTSSIPPGWTEDDLKEYIQWSERVVSKLRGTDEKLESIYDETLKSAK